MQADIKYLYINWWKKY